MALKMKRENAEMTYKEAVQIISERHPLHGQGHAHTFHIQNTSAMVVGLCFLPLPNCIGVVQLGMNRLWTYSLQGEAQESVVVPGLDASALSAMRSKPNQVVIADALNGCLHVLSLASDLTKGAGKAKRQIAEHQIWKLPFKPFDVKSFKENVLLVACACQPRVCFFTEDGLHLGTVNIQANMKSLVSVSGGRRGVWVCGKTSDSNSDLIVLINSRGKVLKTYGEKRSNQPNVRDPHALLEDKEGHVIIADSGNSRYHFLDNHGNFQKFLLQADDGLCRPTLLHLDYSAQVPRLITACVQEKNCQISVYDYKALISTSRRPPALFDKEKLETGGKTDHSSAVHLDTSGSTQRKQDDGIYIREIDIQSERGLLHAFRLQNSVDTVGAVIFLPFFQCICLIQQGRDRLYFYSVEGCSFGSAKVAKLREPTSLALLRSDPNTIVISDFASKCLVMVSVTRTDDDERCMKADVQAVWRLNFCPIQVCLFKAKIFVVNGTGGIVTILTEHGQKLGSIDIQIENFLLLARIVPTSDGLIVLDFGEQGAVYRVDGSGRVVMTYDGKRAGQKALHRAAGLAVLPNGNIIIADSGNHRLQLVDKQGNFLRFLVEGIATMPCPQNLHLDASSEKDLLLVPCGAVGDCQLKVYDCDALLACSGSTIFFDEEEESDKN